MSYSTQLLLPRTSHNNQSLFSDYYLDHFLPEQWGVLEAEAEDIMHQLNQLYTCFTPNTRNEAQTEDDWIKPVLHMLGHTFEVQVPLDVSKSVQKPDYIFYRDEATRIGNKGKVVTSELLKKGALAIGDAKQWDRSLDRAVKGSDAFTNKNPSYQISFYMLHSGLPWGILTNGRIWRLYHIQTAHKLEVFYEVDLPALLQTKEVSQFLYFYTFFRRNAFEQGPLTLEEILIASTEYARNISDNLRQQVYDALRFVAQGFFDYPENCLTATPETCKLIYDNSLTLLYRLLFILYAEARDLLPLNESANYQRTYSLHAIKNEIVINLQEGLLPTSGMVWARLKALFNIINLGSPPLKVTTFNGGLFDAKRHPFLERYTVGDLNLCKAIDKLARVKLQFVDYRDLAERHLGTIYEGLLEYTLRVATKPMVEIKSTSQIVPAEGVPKKHVVAEFKEGEVYLVTDKGERKITGSYYTPDYIVKYMVDQTLHPLLEDAVKNAHTDTMCIQNVLAINVLDPSMGSGHFPVEVVEYIARFLVALGIRPEDTEEADIAYWKRRVVQQCIYGVDVNPLAVELAKLSLWLVTAAKDRPLSFLDHHLRVGNTLIGSWLSDITTQQFKGKKQGEKLVKKVQEVDSEISQLSFVNDEDFQQNTSIALNSIAAIESSPGATIKDVKVQEAAYNELRWCFSEKYLRLANLGAAIYFDLGIDSKLWKYLADYALGKAVVQTPQFERIINQVDDIAQKKRFFHWELEFPDIFFDQQGQSLGEKAGFDVVLGNPPYVRQEQLRSDKPYFQEHYQVYHGKADLFVYFFAQGLRLLRTNGKLAYISSNSWLRTDYATFLRSFLRTQTTVETIIDLGDNRIFDDAPDLTPAIQVVKNAIPEASNIAQVAVFTRGEGIIAFGDQVISKLTNVSIHSQSDAGWQLTNDTSRILFTKLMALGRPLGEVVNKSMYLGIKTGLNDAFIIDQNKRDELVKSDPKCSNLLKPMLRGEDLRPWYQENEGRWLICIPSGWTKRTFQIPALSEELAWEMLSQRHPGIVSHLLAFEEVARKRQDKGYFWWELRSCDYYNEFEIPNIFWAPIGKFPRYSWDDTGLFVNNAGFFLIPNNISLLGFLQSRVAWFCTSRLCTTLGERAGLVRYQQFIQFITNLPVPVLSDEIQVTLTELVKQLTKISRCRYELRSKTARRIQNDLGTYQVRLNQRLELWWDLSFREFRVELMKVFKRDIPLKERDSWEEFLEERKRQIEDFTKEIVKLETELNYVVYKAFCLETEEIELIEQETRYQYGEW